MLTTPHPLELTPFALAQRYIGIREIGGGKSHPLIAWWLSLCSLSIESPDETPWCSAFVNGICWELRLPRSKSAAARSWLAVGTPIIEWPTEAEPGFDVVILARGTGLQGHVGFYGGYDGERVFVLAGNQGDQVCVLPFPAAQVLGVRRLA